MKVKGTLKPSSTPQTLGARIRVVRKAWDWTQEDLAQALKTDRQIVSYWERGISKPSRPAMQLLVRLFRLSAEALLVGTGFSIPDLPEGDHALGKESLREMLPASEIGKVLILGAESGKSKLTSFEQAIKRLKVAETEGYMVWLVVSEP